MAEKEHPPKEKPHSGEARPVSVPKKPEGKPSEKQVAGSVPRKTAHPPSGLRVNVYSVEGEVKGSVDLPRAFGHEPRPDLVNRAVITIQANRRQPYGHSPRSGMRHAVSWWGKGRGVSRVPRLTGSRRGAQANNTVGGMPGHGPKSWRDWTQKINRKENHLAKLSALAATKEAALVSSRGHRYKESLSLPVVVEDALEGIEQTEKAQEIFSKLGVWEDVQQSRLSHHLRPGKGKLRGRPFRTKRSVLVVLSSRDHARAFENLSGVEVTTPRGLNAENLAPGGHLGRLAVFSEKALEEVATW